MYLIVSLLLWQILFHSQFQKFMTIPFSQLFFNFKKRIKSIIKPNPTKPLPIILFRLLSKIRLACDRFLGWHHLKPFGELTSSFLILSNVSTIDSFSKVKSLHVGTSLTFFQSNTCKVTVSLLQVTESIKGAPIE